jgi:hypothetical protein
VPVGLVTALLGGELLAVDVKTGGTIKPLLFRFVTTLKVALM